MSNVLLLCATVHAGDAATNALKLYDDGCVLNVNPVGAKLSAVFPLRTTTALTAQLADSLSLSFASPAGTSVVCDVVPHESVTFAGAVSSATAQR